MTDREKIMEMVSRAKQAMLGENLNCRLARDGFFADYLIAHGVTIQRWIPVTERLPKKELEEYKRLGWDVYPCLAYLGTFVTKLFFDGKNFINIEGVSYTAEVTHWRPLPEPPKEDE